MYRVEDTHWWYGALRRHVARAVEAEALRLGHPPRLLDAGAGTGGMLARLAPLVDGWGVEIAAEGLQFCRKRGLEYLVQGSVSELPYRSATFDVVLCLDVLYHRGVPDDVAAAQELARVLRPGGLLILNLPAYDRLRGAHDAAIHTARRYSRAGVLRLLAAACLRAERVTHWNSLLLPAAAAARVLSRLRPRDAASDVHPVWPPLNTALAGVMRLEETCFSRVSPPFGLSLLTLARK
jgi:SAM-dependent methyltransferase